MANYQAGVVVEQLRPIQFAAPFSQQDALLATVLYADVFDYALTRTELHRYFIGLPATQAEIDCLLSNIDAQLPISVRGQFITMAGRENLISVRQKREKVAEGLWRQALQSKTTLAALPFVRMVAITGALAMNNTDPGSDIDLFIVTSPGRLWLARAFVIGVVKLAALRGATLCPNYLVTERALMVRDRNIFTAHELHQMTPILGYSLYRHMMSINNWASDFLPNAREMSNLPHGGSETLPRAKKFAETMLALPIATRIERWEMKRKSARFVKQASSSGNGAAREANFGPDWCKGHFEGHAHKTLQTYFDRLESLGIEGIVNYGA
jgi:hypothetical protein